MATKTFTRDFSFTPASANSLLKALNRNVNPKTADVSHITEIDNSDDLKNFFRR